MHTISSSVQAIPRTLRPRFPWEEQLRNSGIEISLMVPCLDEEDNVAKTLDNIRHAMAIVNKTYEVFVIDDGSTDATSECIREYQSRHPDMPIYLHRNEVNRGIARNYVDGAFMAKGWYYRMINGDAVEPAESIASVLRHVGEADIIIPYSHQAKDKPLARRILSAAFVKIVNLCSGHKLQYYNGLPIFRTIDLLRMHTQGRGFAFQAETLTRMLDAGLSYVEVYEDIPTERSAGKSKAISLHNLLSTGYAIFRIFMNRLGRAFFD